MQNFIAIRPAVRRPFQKKTSGVGLHHPHPPMRARVKMTHEKVMNDAYNSKKLQVKTNDATPFRYAFSVIKVPTLAISFEICHVYTALLVL